MVGVSMSAIDIAGRSKGLSGSSIMNTLAFDIVGPSPDIRAGFP